MEKELMRCKFNDAMGDDIIYRKSVKVEMHEDGTFKSYDLECGVLGEIYTKNDGYFAYYDQFGETSIRTFRDAVLEKIKIIISKQEKYVEDLKKQLQNEETKLKFNQLTSNTLIRSCYMEKIYRYFYDNGVLKKETGRCFMPFEKDKDILFCGNGFDFYKDFSEMETRYFTLAVKDLDKLRKTITTGTFSMYSLNENAEEFFKTEYEKINDEKYLAMLELKESLRFNKDPNVIEAFEKLEKFLLREEEKKHEN